MQSLQESILEFRYHVESISLFFEMTDDSQLHRSNKKFYFLRQAQHLF